MDETKTDVPSGRVWSRGGLALVLLPLIGLSPTNLFNNSPSVDRPVEVRKITRFEPKGRGWVYETIRLYAVLRAHRRRLPEFVAWSIAKAIVAESRRHEIDPMLILAVVKVESSFRPDAVSPKGATGLMQILPFVARSLAQEVGLTSEHIDRNLYDPELNVRLGVHYLMGLKETFADTKLALIAYHRGPTEVRRRLLENRPLPSGYADKVLAVRDFFNGLTPSLVANWTE